MAGPTGATGATGSTGPTGATGATGPTGFGGRIKNDDGPDFTRRDIINFVRAAGGASGGILVVDDSVTLSTDIQVDNTVVAFLLGAQTLDAKALTNASNITQTGAATFTTGTGAVTLNGNTTIAGANTFTVAGGLATLSAGVAVTGTATVTPGGNASGLVISGSTISGTAANPLVDLSHTWNTTGAPTGIKLNITNTASDAASKLLDLQVGGTPMFSVRRDGQTTIPGASALVLGTAGPTGGLTGGIVFNNAANANTVTLRAGTTGATNPVFTLPIADGTNKQVLSTNASGQLAFITVAAPDIDNSGANKKFLVNVPGTLADNLVTPTTAAVPGITIQQGLTGTPGNLFAVESNAGTNNFLKIDGSGNTTVGHSGITTGNTFSVLTGATVGTAATISAPVANGGTALKIDTGASTFNNTSAGGLNVLSTGAFTGSLAQINMQSSVTGKGLDVQANALTTGSALNINVGASAPTTQSSVLGLGLNVSGAGSFAGLNNSASLVRVSSGTANFSGTLVKLVADSTQTGTVLGISAQGLTTGRAIDVSLGALYSGTNDGSGDIGAVNVRSGAFTGNIFSVSATSTGAGATSNLANFSSPQLDGRIVHVNATGLYGGVTGALNVTLIPTLPGGTVGGTAATVNVDDRFTGKALNLNLSTGTGGATGYAATAGAGFTGSLADFQVNSVSVFKVTQTGAITTAGNFSQTGATTFSTGTGGVSLNANTTVTSAGASALAVGAAGATNPALNVDASTASSATGLQLKSAAAGGGLAVSVLSSGAAESLTVNAKGAGTITLGNTSTGNIVLSRNTGVTGNLTVTSASATATVIGAAGATNPAFSVDSSTASSATGLLLKSAAAAGGLALSVTSSGANESLTVDAKGTGTIALGATSTGNILLNRPTVVTATSPSAFAVGLGGATNPALNVDSSTALSATGLQVKSAAAAGGLALSVISSGANESLTIDAKGTGTTTIGGTSTGNITLGRNTAVAGTLTVTSAGAAALTVGPNGATNPALTVDASTASSATGLSIKSAAAAGGVALAVTSSGANESLTVNAKGTGTITIGGTSTGIITLGSTANSVAIPGTLAVGTSSSVAGAVTFRTNAGANTVTLQAPATNPAASFTLRLPSALPGTTGQALVSDTSGNLSFVTVATATIDVAAVDTASSSTTLIDTDLTFAVPADTIVYFDADLFYATSATATGLAASVNVDQAPQNIAYQLVLPTSATVGFQGGSTVNNGKAGPAATTISTTSNFARLSGIVKGHATLAGTATIRISSENTGTITLKIGSRVRSST